ncbi:MAG: 8-oxoguanine deaminase [Elusimicrobiota bacterium]
MKSNLKLIKNSILVATIDDKNSKVAGGEILIEGKEIKAVGKNIEKNFRLKKNTYKIIDASNCVVIPGFVNVHHHLYQTLNRAIPAVQNAELFDWIKTLYQVWRKINPEWVYASSRVGFAELLLTGCTTTNDQYYIYPKDQPKDLLDYEIQAAGEIGIRFHPCRGSMSRGESLGGLPPDDLVQTEDEIMKDCRRVIEKFNDPEKFSMCRVMLAPCSPFSVTTELLKQTTEFARSIPDAKIHCHTHIAETKDEEDYCVQTHGVRPVKYMENLCWLGEDVSFAHCIHLNDDELKLLGATKTGVAHCPTSNLRLSSGIAPVRDLLDSGARVGLGVDGSASNDSSNMLAELRQCVLVHRYHSGVTSMPVEDVLRLATRSGASVLGRDDIGSIEPGKAADIVLFDMNNVSYAGAMHDPLAALIFCGFSQKAKTVIVDGKIIVDKWHLLTVDEDEITNKGNAVAQKLI